MSMNSSLVVKQFHHNLGDVLVARGVPVFIGGRYPGVHFVYEGKASSFLVKPFQSLGCPGMFRVYLNCEVFNSWQNEQTSMRLEVGFVAPWSKVQGEWTVMALELDLALARALIAVALGESVKLPSSFSPADSLECARHYAHSLAAAQAREGYLSRRRRCA